MNTRLSDARREKKLGISTGAADFEKDDANHSRYEPTPYAVLERLAESGYIGKGDTLVDYGCGKGRVSFYMDYAVGCRNVGVEYDPALAAAAEKNLSTYSGRSGAETRIRFACESAEEYAVGDADRFYFFNPFSVKILQSVLGRIREAYYEQPREMYLFFYYALDPYLDLLMTDDLIRFAGEIDCRDLFGGNDVRERIMVFELEG
jgi:SAM-dependent methyltransferase